MYIVDTNVLSESRKVPQGAADAAVTTWLAQVHDSDLYLTAITVKEVELGILRMERRDPMQGKTLRQWWTTILHDYRDRILPLDERVATRAAALHVPNPASEADAYIAAIALEHGFVLVTRNVRDFARFPGLALINPWNQ